MNCRSLPWLTALVLAPARLSPDNAAALTGARTKTDYETVPVYIIQIQRVMTVDGRFVDAVVAVAQPAPEGVAAGAADEGVVAAGAAIEPVVTAARQLSDCRGSRQRSHYRRCRRSR